jgi:hypothetical protein
VKEKRIVIKIVMNVVSHVIVKEREVIVIEVDQKIKKKDEDHVLKIKEEIEIMMIKNVTENEVVQQKKSKFYF